MARRNRNPEAVSAIVEGSGTAEVSGGITWRGKAAENAEFNFGTQMNAGRGCELPSRGVHSPGTRIKESVSEGSVHPCAILLPREYVFYFSQQT